jgi:hypothetical protein
MMLSTSGFYQLIGGGKPDNAAAQYGIAAFVWLVLRPAMGRRAIVMAGLCAGWALASRYTNVFLIPALMVSGLIALPRPRRLATFKTVVGHLHKSLLTDVLIAGIAMGLAVVPMFIKNWILVGCPLAPAFGCQETVWSGVTWVKGASWVYNRQGISLFDLLFVSLYLDLCSPPKYARQCLSAFYGFPSISFALLSFFHCPPRIDSWFGRPDFSNYMVVVHQPTVSVHSMDPGTSRTTCSMPQ